MPKPKKKVTKSDENKEETKEIILDDEEKVLDPELVVGDILPEDEEDEEGITDDEELDPFKDRWEE